jgi:O-antigen/teichoic acid export membrane protein
LTEAEAPEAEPREPVDSATRPSTARRAAGLSRRIGSLAFGSAAVRGVGSLLVARVIVGAATLLLFALIARTLPATEFGLFGLAWSVSYFLATIAEGGFGLLVVREVARRPSVTGHYLGAFLSVRGAITVVALLATLAAAATTGWESVATVIAMAATAAFLQAVSGVPRDFLIARDSTELAALHSIAETILRTAVIVPTAALTSSVTATFAAAAAFHLVWTGVGLALIRILMHPIGVLAGMRSWARVLRQSLPYGGLVILTSAYAQLDVILVSALVPLDAAALYIAASRLLAATDYVPEAAWRWAYPRLSRSIAQVARLATRLATALLALGVLVGTLVLLTSPVVIPAVFGDAYRSASRPMALMAAAIPLRYLAHVYGTALSAGGRQTSRTMTFGAVVLAAIVVEILLIRAAGIYGAALAITSSSTLLVTAWFVVARRGWGRDLDVKQPILAAAATAALILVAVAVPV